MSWPHVALLSLSDLTGAAEFASRLASRGTRLLASGGTARHLGEAGLEVTTVESWTGSPELLGGRVKTLHPNVHAAILARRDAPVDLASLDARGIAPIDLVAVSLYPFEDRGPGLDDAGMVEEIDIGGVALLRAAAKNHRDVIVAHDAAQYAAILAALEAGGPTADERRAWATAAFARTARYDAAIASELSRRAGEDPPATLLLALERLRTLRYGENPHQHGALYAPAGATPGLHATREGKELSYNNVLDVEAATTLVARYDMPACVIVKHHQPCGVACASDSAEAYALAFAADPVSAFGGIVAFNRPLDAATAAKVSEPFVECVVAPAFEPGAEAAFAKKKNVRLLRLEPQAVAASGSAWTLRQTGFTWLAQRAGDEPAPPWTVATRRAPSDAERRALEFAWTVVAAMPSNAIAIARGTQTVGLGAGQTSRVDAVDVALLKARRAGHDVRGAVLASDAFFPFADNIDHAAAAGITAIVQPGGSMRDGEVLEACERHGIAMMLTGRREFRH